MLKIKQGVKVIGIRPEMALFMTLAESAFSSYGLDCIVTSVVDSKHKAGSAHYTGRAVDLRIRHIPGYEIDGNQAALVNSIYNDLKLAAGENFDVVLEGNHIHCEYDPKDPVGGG